MKALNVQHHEGCAARLMYVLGAVADPQLGVHKHPFGANTYKKQNYLPHYSDNMRQLIEQQGKGA